MEFMSIYGDRKNRTAIKGEAMDDYQVICVQSSIVHFDKWAYICKTIGNNNLKMKTSMKNMYLAVAMAISLAFYGLSDDESGKADRAYNPIEILGTINDATDVQNTRAVGSNWGS